MKVLTAAVLVVTCLVGLAAPADAHHKRPPNGAHVAS